MCIALAHEYCNVQACCEHIWHCRGLDFDDLLSWPVAMLQNCPNVRQKLQKRYKHILVDEFQDTNAPQVLSQLLTFCIVAFLP